MTAPDHVSEFIAHGTYLRGWSDKTAEVYRLSLNAFDGPLMRPRVQTRSLPLGCASSSCGCGTEA
jgi:hypothetical protein